MAETRERKITRLMAQWPGLEHIGSRGLEDGSSFSEVQARYLESLSHQYGNPSRATTGLEVGETYSHDPTWRAAAADCILLRANGRIPGVLSPGERERREEAAREVSGVIGSECLLGIARRSMRNPPGGRHRNNDLVSRALTASSSDFPGIGLDAFSKAVHGYFDEQPQNWRPISKIRNAPDFRNLNSIGMADVGSLTLTPEGAPLSGGTFVEVKETAYSLQTYGKSAGVSRQILINASLQAFSAVAEAHAIAASRLIHDLAFSLLTNNAGLGPTMAEDGLNLFSTTHPSGANYAVGAVTCDFSGVTILAALMRKQRGMAASVETGPMLNIVPKILLVPSSLEGTARNTVSDFANSERPANADPAIVENYGVVVEPRLDAATNGATGGIW